MLPVTDRITASWPGLRPIAAALGDWVRPSRQPHALLLREDAVWDAGTAQAPILPTRRHDSFEAWCGAHPLGLCDVFVSGTMVHDLVCDPSLPAGSDAALLEHAQRVFNHYHGEGVRDWRLAAWSSQGQRGVSALHGAELSGLLSAARSHGVRMRTLQPWWSRVLALALRRLPSLHKTARAWLIIVEGPFASALCLRQGRCTGLRSQWLPDRCPTVLESFAAQLQSEGGTDPDTSPVIALGFGLAPGTPQGVRVLGSLDESGPAGHWLSQRSVRP